VKTVDLCAAGHDAFQNVGEIFLRVDFVEFASLCRPSNYAERVCFPQISR
jgi:hypothetical protein